MERGDAKERERVEGEGVSEGREEMRGRRGEIKQEKEKAN